MVLSIKSGCKLPVMNLKKVNFLQPHHNISLTRKKKSHFDARKSSFKFNVSSFVCRTEWCKLFDVKALSRACYDWKNLKSTKGSKTEFVYNIKEVDGKEVDVGERQRRFFGEIEWEFDVFGSWIVVGWLKGNRYK